MTMTSEEIVVTISGYDPVSGKAMVSDPYGGEFEVLCLAYAPKPGERWLISKHVGLWMLDVRFDAAPPSVVTGEVEENYVLAQMLAVLDQEGLIIDTTTGGLLEDPIYDDDNDPPEGDPWDEEYQDEDDYELPPDVEVEEPEPETPPYTPPENDGKPESGGPKGEEHQPHGQPIKGENDHPVGSFSVITYNQYSGLGPQRAKKDWRALKATKAGVILWQECRNRENLFEAYESDQWGVYFPQWTGSPSTADDIFGPENNPITWKKKEFRLLQADHKLLHLASGGRPSHWASWTRFLHRPTGAVITTVNTHLDVKAITNGSWNDDYPQHVAAYKEALGNLSTLVTQLKRKGGMVIVGGDFNYHWEKVAKKGSPNNSPRGVFRQLDMKCNWEVLGLGKVPTRRKSGWIDYQWMFTPKGYRGVFQSQKVLTGYQSDHRPVLVTYKLRGEKEATSPPPEATKGDLVIGTWNVGAGGSLADQNELLDMIGPYGVLCGQEYGDREALRAAASARGWTVLEDGGFGSSRVPLMAGPKVTVVRPISHMVLPLGDYGPGAGPDDVGPKYLIGGVLRSQGVTFGCFSTHYVASHQNPGRRAAALTQSNNIVAFMKTLNPEIPWFICGDFNQTPNNPFGTIGPLLKNGWTHNHKAGKMIGTHEKRAIDYVWWKSKRVRFISHREVRNGSDHDAIIATLRIRELS